MDAAEITDILENYLRAQNVDVRLYREKKIGSAVCDLMAVTDRLIGYEIKSDVDNYSRLYGQIAAYDAFFNRNYIVVSDGHIKSVAEKIPSHWGIILVGEDKVSCERAARKNIQVSLENQLSVLWEAELKNLLVRNNLPSYTMRGRKFIIDELALKVPTDTLTAQIAAELKNRNYALVYGEDGGDEGADIFGRELVDILSDAIGGNFTLDKWIEIFSRAKRVSERKHLVAQKIAENRAEHKITYKDIEVSLGVPWISVGIVNEFVYHILDMGNPEIYKRYKGWLENHPYIVRYEEVTGNWSLRYKDYFSEGNSNSLIKYGIESYNALYIIEATLNLREIRLKDSRGRYDETATIAALEKQRLICEEFKAWIFKDEDRIWAVEEAYNALFDGLNVAKFDGSKLSFPDMNPDIVLYDYQKDAVQKIISSPNTLLAFDVGAGKTYIMAAAAMLMRKSGVSRKNMFVVPNNIVGQWELMFTWLFPSAKVLTIEPKSFRKEVREKLLGQACDGDYDAIIVAYSCFEMIPLSKDYIFGQLNMRIEFLQSQIKSLRSLGYEWGEAPLEREIKYVTNSLHELAKGTAENMSEITFDKLGVNTLFIDEAHNFKNIPIRTNLKNLRGINVIGSKKCLDLLEKVWCVQHSNGGRGAVFATGTPLCNSISDVYAMQMYLQHDLLQARRLDRFDNWVKTFARPEQMCEIDVNSSGFRFVRRFSKFFNLTELSMLFSQVSVFYAMDKTGLPEIQEYSDTVIEPSENFSAYMQELVARTEQIRAKKVVSTQDNMLKVTTDGRKAALDLTLVDSVQQYDKSSKIVNCVENVVGIYKKYSGCTQLIFCDYSTPKGLNFNVYDELKSRLTSCGIPQREIAFIHSCKDEAAKLELYAKFNSGEVRVIIGSTFKLGIGANVQRKLKAVHHIDVPWRPADMVQREGRILRRGNENSEVIIFRYILRGSFDAYSWQILQTKQRFISQFLCGSGYMRTASDLENNVLTYAEVKALALSDPRMKTLAEKENELRNLRVLYMQECETKERLMLEKSELEKSIPERQSELLQTTENKKYIESFNKSELKEHITSACELLKDVNMFVPKAEAVAEICGFSVFVPTKQSEKKPYIILSRGGVNYMVEIGQMAVGNVRRFVNFFTNFSKQVELKRQAAEDCSARLAEVERQMALPCEYDKKLAAATEEYDNLLAKLRETLDDK